MFSLALRTLWNCSPVCNWRLSLVPLYEDDLQLSSAIELMEAIGLRLAAILPGFTDPVTSETLQCDGVFLRHTE